MLERYFQKYYAASDSAPTGILDGDVAAPEGVAPVLRHAVALAGIVLVLYMQVGSFEVLHLQGTGKVLAKMPQLTATHGCWCAFSCCGQNMHIMQSADNA